MVIGDESVILYYDSLLKIDSINWQKSSEKRPAKVNALTRKRKLPVA